MGCDVSNSIHNNDANVSDGNDVNDRNVDEIHNDDNADGEEASTDAGSRLLPGADGCFGGHTFGKRKRIIFGLNLFIF